MNEKILTQEEINALLDAVSSDKGSSERREKKKSGETKTVRSHSDFGAKGNLFPLVKTQTLTKDVQNALALIFDAFAHKGSSTLSTSLRTHVSFKLEAMEQSQYGEFIENLPEPSSMWYLGMNPHELHTAVCLEPSLVHAIISVMMGGGNTTISKTRRNITELEQTVIETVVLQFCRELRHAWSRVLDVEVGIDNRETRPRLLQIYPPSEAMVVVHMTMKVGPTEGEIYWGMPGSLLKILQTHLNQQSQMENNQKLAQVVQKMKERILRIPTRLEVELSPTPVTINELINLEVGDILKLEHRVSDPVAFKVNGREKLKGGIVLSNDRKAIQILQEN